MDLDAFHSLLTAEGQQLLADVDVAYDQSDTLALGTRFRRSHSAALVAAAFEQLELRRRAVAKFGSDAARMYFTRAGLEQATAPAVAQYRFRRLVARGLPTQGGRSLADLCCGIGGDLVMAGGLFDEVTGVDLDPLACAVARANLTAWGIGARVVEADVEAYPFDDYDLVFVDPARRAGRGRVWHRDDYRPRWGFVERVLGRTACVKTTAALPHDAVPIGVEAEWISLDGQTREACLWSPDLSSTTRRATVLVSDPPAIPVAHSITADQLSDDGPIREMGRYVHEVDPAVTAAHLVPVVVDLLGGWLLDRHIGYVSSDEPTKSTFTRTYEVVDEVPYQRKQLKAALRQRDIGPITIKRRGVDVDPVRLRRELGLRGSTEATLLLTRTPTGARAYLVSAPT
jgi:hypothetical protein